MSLVRTADRLLTLPKETIWHEMTPLANEHKAVNLGQGFPSFPPPPFLLEELQRIIEESAIHPINHQYARAQGHPDLVAAIANMYIKRLSRVDVTESNVLVTNGTTQALNITFQALLNHGDEVIVFEPFYDAYIHDIELAGGVVKYVQLTPSESNIADDWCFSESQLLAAVTPKTKVILLNTPQNIPGKTWTRDELHLLTRVAIDKDLVVVSDEVYMTLAYDSPHISIASIPGMWERTLTVCSIGKMFSCTGWKIGWAVGPSWLIHPLSQIAAYQTFSVATPLQIAAARAIQRAEGNDYHEIHAAGYMVRRDLLCEVLTSIGLTPVKPSSGFFVLADISRVDPAHYYNPEDKQYAKDWQFCRWLVKAIGVCAIPTTAFCATESRKLYEKYVRFAFCKTEDDIREAAVRLKKLQNHFLESTKDK
ncbi:putative kynurenine aminotransferase [Trypanosoma theileri]|uniref:Putative kynurenine aminotransferase n=1 Tax=Trypanosoma theileri TaxID=67003 RepID=A0A1X0P1M2_9TRYP|nr:putative kynurenine aminotransferase [Trypanosoma theileri]ORC90593.1 putative kynurenine aminotransferase [Trypanosoma theileri]